MPSGRLALLPRACARARVSKFAQRVPAVLANLLARFLTRWFSWSCNGFDPSDTKDTLGCASQLRNQEASGIASWRAFCSGKIDACSG